MHFQTKDYKSQFIIQQSEEKKETYPSNNPKQDFFSQNTENDEENPIIFLNKNPKKTTKIPKKQQKTPQISL